MQAKRAGRKSRGKFWYLTAEYRKFSEDLREAAIQQLAAQGWRMVTDWPVWVGVKIKAHANLLDMSNLLGTIEDALNGVAWLDDCQAFLDQSPGLLISNMGKDEYTIEIYLRTDPDQSAECVNYVRDGLRRRGVRIAKRALTRAAMP